VIIDKANRGVSSARNKGLMAAKNEYVALIDGDDIWHPNHLEILQYSITKCDGEEVGGVASAFYKSINKEFVESKFSMKEPTVIKDFFSFMSSPNTKFYTSTVMIKKSKILETGLFNEQFAFGEDIDCWMRLFSKYELIYNPTVTATYFLGAENRSIHKVIPLHKRFHVFNYKGKSKAEKRYLDKLVALILIDYYDLRSLKPMLAISKMYYYRMFGVFYYIFRLIINKVSRIFKTN
jgi:glycosyltransferase involved in cell wall biosynthesis